MTVLGPIGEGRGVASDPKGLIEQATRARKAELEEVAEQERRAKQARRPVTTALVERPGVWLNLRRGPHLGGIIAAAIGWWFALGFVALPELRLVAAGAGLLGLVATTFVARSFLTLRRWRARLPFPVDGWASLVDQELLWIDEMWWHVTVSVPGSADAATRAAWLERLCTRAKATYYVPEHRSDDERLPWRVDGEVALGSANRNTAYALARWCLEDLAPVAAGGAIERVVLTVVQGPISVSRPSSD